MPQPKPAIPNRSRRSVNGQSDPIANGSAETATYCSHIGAMIRTMAESGPRATALRAGFDELLADPTVDGLWAFQKQLLMLDGPAAAKARAVVHAFHGCLRRLQSKSASRAASRLGAVLGTAAVGSASLPELRDRQELSINELVELALPAVLEVGASVKTAQAWEIEAGTIYDEFAWFLDEELWEISAAVRPDLAPEERRARIDDVLAPLLDSALPDEDRGALLVDVFRSILAARVLPLLAG
jgi:hypothetical protein